MVWENLKKEVNEGVSEDVNVSEDADAKEECLTDTEKLLEENTQLKKEIKEVERLKVELEALKMSLEQENKRLAHEKTLFDSRYQILENGFKQLSIDKEAFQKEKVIFDAKKRETRTEEFFEGKAEGNISFFKGVTNPLGLKKRYKDLLKIYHPDNLCGDTYTIQTINKEYETLNKKMYHQNYQSQQSHQRKA